MKALLRLISVSICLILLAACGNKGDLFLEPVELSPEQKALLDELDSGGKEDGQQDNQEDSEEEKKKKLSGQTPETSQ